MGVAGVLRAWSAPARAAREGRAAGQRVVDHRPLGPHTASVRRAGGCRVRPGLRLPAGASPPIVTMYQLDTSRPIRQREVRRWPSGPTSSSSPSSACCTRPRCTATSCASGSTRPSAHSGRSPTARSTPASRAAGRRPGHRAGRSCRRPTGKRSPDRLQAHRRGQGALRRPARRERSPAWDDEGFGVHFAFFARTDAADPAADPGRPPDAGSRSGSTASGPRSPAAASGSTATPSNCSGTGWSRSSARCAGWTS